MTVDPQNHSKAISLHLLDQKWGLTVYSVGIQHVSENEVYPSPLPPTHTILGTGNLFSILYITKGKGSLSTSSSGLSNLQEGNMFLLFPGEWHTYKPHPSTGWQVYWICFNGKIMDEWVNQGFFYKKSPVLNIGINEDIVSLFERALIMYNSQKQNCQLYLASIASYIISMAIYMSGKTKIEKSDLDHIVTQPKAAIHENISTVTPEDLAKIVCMSYSKFRKVFKKYTRLAPFNIFRRQG